MYNLVTTGGNTVLYKKKSIECDKETSFTRHTYIKSLCCTLSVSYSFVKYTSIKLRKIVKKIFKNVG